MDAWNRRRRELACQYNQALCSLPSLATPYQAHDCDHINHVYILRLDDRSHIQTALQRAGIATAVYYPQSIYMAHTCANLGYRLDDFPHAETASQQTLAIPIFTEMTNDQVAFLLDTLTTTLS